MEKEKRNGGKGGNCPKEFHTPSPALAPAAIHLCNMRRGGGGGGGRRWCSFLFSRNGGSNWFQIAVVVVSPFFAVETSDVIAEN